MEEYRSVEKKIFESAKPFVHQAGGVAYGLVAGLFRIPTTIRKASNGQLILQRILDDYDEEEGAVGTGIIFGIGSILGAGVLFYNEAVKGNYIPLAVLGATNVASGIYEAIRNVRGKQNENLQKMIDSVTLGKRELKDNPQRF